MELRLGEPPCARKMLNKKVIFWAISQIDKVLKLLRIARANVIIVKNFFFVVNYS